VDESDGAAGLAGASLTYFVEYCDIPCCGMASARLRNPRLACIAFQIVNAVVEVDAVFFEESVQFVPCLHAEQTSHLCCGKCVRRVTFDSQTAARLVLQSAG
jgi:hypothetical protein